MPAVFQSLQDMDEKRVKCIQNFMRKSAQTEQDVLPIISQCLEGIQRCTDAMDEKEVSRLELSQSFCKMKSVSEWGNRFINWGNKHENL